MGQGNGAALSNRQRKNLERRNKARAMPQKAKGPQEVVRHQVTISRAVIEPENLRWFVLRVQSQKEEAVVRVFDMMSIPAAIPTAPREARRRGKLHKWRVPIAPGYVLVGFPGSGEIPWREVFRFGIVRAPICDAEDRPLQAPWRSLYLKDGALKTRCGVETFLGDLDEIRVGAAKFMRTWARYEKDEKVRVEAGPFAGFEGTIERVTEEDARVLLMIFGRQTPAQIHVGDLVKAA